ncbi:MAG: DUF2721 domain-containing protein [Archangium sp.]|nr:DUF2721 domain-containing protein [Archangium sp.]
MPPSAFSDIPHVIQLAIAPVFLLSSIGTILSVLSLRLGRIVDRMRVLLDRRDSVSPERAKKGEAELLLLVRRRTIVNHAITWTTTAALLVCVLIGTAFIGSLLGLNTGVLIAALFALAMVAFIAGLFEFLHEVRVASRSTHVEFH